MISGKTLTCQVLDMDRYGRYVAQCFLPDGRDIAAEASGGFFHIVGDFGVRKPKHVSHDLNGQFDLLRRMAVFGFHLNQPPNGLLISSERRTG